MLTPIRYPQVLGSLRRASAAAIAQRAVDALRQRHPVGRVSLAVCLQPEGRVFLESPSRVKPLAAVAVITRGSSADALAAQLEQAWALINE